ncbi:MAG: hypothetical protein IKD45_03160 [Clostridia bacterium]|nr:hypothetical protein [Clostridia bacterium]
MKNILIKLLLLTLAMAVMLCLAACNNTTPPEGGGEGEGEGEGTGENKDPDTSIDWDKVPLEGMPLIYNKVARFQVVYTTDGGSTGVREAEDLVARLVELGVEIGPAVSDKDAKDVRDCEIIIGTGARHRGDEVNVSKRYLGNDGMVIKIVGNRIIIAGGSPNLLKDAVTHFTKNELDLYDKKLKELKELDVDPTYFMERLTDYYFDSISIAGNSIADYTVVEDFGDFAYMAYSKEAIEAFREELYQSSGFWLDLGKAENIDSYDKKIIIRYNPDMENEAGFAAYVDADSNLIVECAYANSFDTAYRKFVDKTIFDQTKTELTFGKSFKYVDRVCEVTYEQFGATDNGEADDDFQAIYDTHVYANQCGQKVLGKADATYYVKLLPKTIPVKTDVDFLGATIKVNDKGSDAYKTRGVCLYTFVREESGIILDEARIDELAGENEKLNIGDWSVPWLAGVITEKSIVKFTNKNHKDVIRHGANQSGGEARRDVFIMYPDGSIDEETEVCFEFDEITSIEIYSTLDEQIVFENGTIINQCYEVVPETQYNNKYHAYARGLDIRRPNVKIYKITHRMEDEPPLITDREQGGSDWGTLHESYPYYAFILTHMAYKLHVLDCSITGHTTYYEDKPETSSTNGKPNPVAQGTYDLAIEESVAVLFENVHQYSETGLGDRRYWGIMTSNWSKDTTFKNCSINRFDAHRTMWGATLYNTDIGHTISVVGGGYFYLEGVDVLTGNTFIDLRADYGGTFRGTIEMVNCTLDAVVDYNSTKGQYMNTSNKSAKATIINCGFYNDNNTGYWDWYFGYDSYMPNVILDNFKSTATESTVVFPTYLDDVFTTIKHKYTLAESIIFRNMEPVPVCSGINSALEMQKIRVINEGYTNKDDEN